MLRQHGRQKRERLLRPAHRLQRGFELSFLEIFLGILEMPEQLVENPLEELAEIQ